jgi:hypothetical protein
VTSYPFLSPEWIDAARALRQEYDDRIPDSPIETRINVIVTEIPHGESDTLDGHIDTSSGQTIIEHGHIDDPELTVTIDYGTAYAAFVTRDQQQVMQAFLGGKIFIDGDATKLLALQAGQPTDDLDPTALELFEKLDALTSRD